MKNSHYIRLGLMVSAFLTASPLYANEGESFASLQVNLNHLWVLCAAVLVFLMQAGFMCLECGVSRAKNSINVAVKNMSDFVIAVLGFWAIGFAVMFGTSKAGIFGGSGFFINISDDGWSTLFFLFQAVFCGTAATIVSGAIAERSKFSMYLIISLVTSVLIYPIFGHWSWGSLLNGETSGWLEQRGFIDFAGSTVVHSVGGWMALAAAIVVGPRIGKFSKEGRANKIPPHNLLLVFLGTFVLFFGWFGFNAGSALEVGTGLGGIALNTMLAGCGGSLSAGLLSWFLSKKRQPDPLEIANGCLAGLVGVTAGCAVVGTAGAVGLGLVAGIVMIAAGAFIEKTLKVDDVVGAVSVHGFCGAWGTIGLALFMPASAIPEGSGRLDILGVQMLGVLVAFVWAFGAGYLLLKAISIVSGGFRVDPGDEEIGLNVAEHGASSSLLDLAKCMQSATRDGNLNTKAEVEYGTEIGDLARSFNSLIEELGRTRDDARDQMQRYEQYMRNLDDKIKGDATAMESIVDKISSGAEKTSSMLSEAASSMSLLLKSVSDASQNSLNASQATSSKVEEVVKSIQSISFQTNILALNASVEAARAGESGAGFAVVADEVRSLSLKTGKATEDIREQISLIHGSNEVVAESIQDSLSSVETLSEDLNRVSEESIEAMRDFKDLEEGSRRIKDRVAKAYDEFSEIIRKTWLDGKGDQRQDRQSSLSWN